MISRSTYCRRLERPVLLFFGVLRRLRDTESLNFTPALNTSCSRPVLFHPASDIAQPLSLPVQPTSTIRRIPHAGVPSISIKDTSQTGLLLATGVTNGGKTIFTLTLIHSFAAVRRVFLAGIISRLTARRRVAARKKKKQVETTSAVIYESSKRSQKFINCREHEGRQ